MFVNEKGAMLSISELENYMLVVSISHRKE